MGILLLLTIALLPCQSWAGMIAYTVNGSFTSPFGGSPLTIDGQPWSLSFQIDTSQAQVVSGGLNILNTTVNVLIPTLTGTNSGSYMTTVRFDPQGAFPGPTPNFELGGSLSLGLPSINFAFSNFEDFVPAVWNSNTGSPQFTLGFFPGIANSGFLVTATPNGGSARQYATAPTMTATATPEPSSVLLMLTALAVSIGMNFMALVGAFSNFLKYSLGYV
jgi:multisubunit Na+/H+ antiporter MnhC subunit